MQNPIVRFRVNPSQRAEIDAFIGDLAKTGLKINRRKPNLSSITRLFWKLLCNKTLAVPKDDEAKELLGDALIELRAIGRNLNQLSKAHHQGKIVFPVEGDVFFAKVMDAVKRQTALTEALRLESSKDHQETLASLFG